MSSSSEDYIEPPETKRDLVVEEMHGHEIKDPYRWLEEDSDDVTSSLPLK